MKLANNIYIIGMILIIIGFGIWIYDMLSENYSGYPTTVVVSNYNK